MSAIGTPQRGGLRRYLCAGCGNESAREVEWKLDGTRTLECLRSDCGHRRTVEPTRNYTHSHAIGWSTPHGDIGVCPECGKTGAVKRVPGERMDCLVITHVYRPEGETEYCVSPLEPAEV